MLKHPQLSTTFRHGCLCGASRCRGSVTGSKDLPFAPKADYGELVAPYLRTMDDKDRWAFRKTAGDSTGALDNRFWNCAERVVLRALAPGRLKAVSHSNTR
jgi:hypothetical protein